MSLPQLGGLGEEASQALALSPQSGNSALQWIQQSSEPWMPVLLLLCLTVTTDKPIPLPGSCLHICEQSELDWIDLEDHSSPYISPRISLHLSVV